MPDDEEPVAKPSQEIKPISLSPVSSPSSQKKSSPVTMLTIFAQLIAMSCCMTHASFFYARIPKLDDEDECLNSGSLSHR